MGYHIPEKDFSTSVEKNDRVEILTMQLPVRDRIKISYNSKIFTGANYTA